MTAIKKKNIFFLVYYSVLIILMTFPGLFEIANRIEPWILGLPFIVFYLFMCVGLLCAGLLCQYLVEDKIGELDFTAEALEELEDKQ